MCGEGGIRTLGTRESTTVFKTVAFNHSATSPSISSLYTISIVSAIWCSLVMMVDAPVRLYLYWTEWESSARLEHVFAPVAQWIERLVAVQKVVGSTPAGRTELSKSCGTLWYNQNHGR